MKLRIKMDIISEQDMRVNVTHESLERERIADAMESRVTRVVESLRTLPLWDLLTSFFPLKPTKPN